MIILTKTDSNSTAVSLLYDQILHLHIVINIAKLCETTERNIW